jgi:predicted flap endonuclease-1-like 5' DNA nuclease
VTTTESEFGPSIGTVAKRELAAHGWLTYEQLATTTPRELLAIHGVGPKAIRVLTAELTERGLAFRAD